MGDPRRLRKKYKTPRHPWQKQRIEHEKKLVKDYGLKNKREVWCAEAFVSKYRTLARRLAARPAAERAREEQRILGKLKTLGILGQDVKAEDILSMTVEAVLERRLQTVVWKKGFAATPKQARQFVTHGKIALDGRRTTTPGLIIGLDREALINWRAGPVRFEAKKGVEKPEPKKAERAEAVEEEPAPTTLKKPH